MNNAASAVSTDGELTPPTHVLFSSTEPVEVVNSQGMMLGRGFGHGYVFSSGPHYDGTKPVGSADIWKSSLTLHERWRDEEIRRSTEDSASSANAQQNTRACVVLHFFARRCSPHVMILFVLTSDREIHPFRFRWVRLVRRSDGNPRQRQ